MKLRVVLGIVALGVLVAGCQKEATPVAVDNEPIPVSVNKAPLDPKLAELDDLRKRAVDGNKDAIHDLIGFPHADGIYAEELYGSIGEVLVKQPKIAMEVLGELEPSVRKNILWYTIASESSNPPGNLLEVITSHQSENPKIAQEIKKTIEVGSEYNKLYSTKGEQAAADYVNAHFKE